MKTLTPAAAGQYRVVVVDPPWKQSKAGKRKARPNVPTDLPYKTAKLDDIPAMHKIPEWAAPDALILLWATQSKLPDGKPVLHSAFEWLARWGAKYHCTLTWDKRTGICPYSAWQFTSEFVLVGRIGSPKFPKESWGKMKTVFAAPKGAHSAKPAEFYAALAEHFPAPRLDVFAREAHSGFDGWGDECEGE